MTRSILLVEDHDANRTVLKRRLERRGFVVHEAADGAEAIDVFARTSAGLILMDLSMPNVSGIEALERIRETKAGESVPVVALTAHAMDSIREKCAESGFNAFLTKPVDFDALMETISALTPADV